jgi:nucleoside-diphosphate-sugar epimerase
MRVLVIGATGYLGTVITEVLVSRGHEVVAMVRSPRELPPGVGMRIADLRDVEAVTAAVGPDVDAVVHAATPLGDWDLERRSVNAAIRGLRFPSKRFVYVSGVWVLGTSTQPDGTTRSHDETSPVNPIDLVAGRESLEADVLDSSVTGVVVRPGVLHGRGAGIPALMTSWAANEGHGVFVGGDDAVTWPCVHVEDAASLAALAVEAGTRGQILHAVAEPAVPAAAIAAAADQSVGGAGLVRRWDTSEAAAQLGSAFSEALALHQDVQSRVAPGLGWLPEGPGIAEDVRSGSYRRNNVSM